VRDHDPDDPDNAGQVQAPEKAFADVRVRPALAVGQALGEERQRRNARAIDPEADGGVLHPLGHNVRRSFVGKFLAQGFERIEQVIQRSHEGLIGSRRSFSAVESVVVTML